MDREWWGRFQQRTGGGGGVRGQPNSPMPHATKAVSNIWISSRSCSAGGGHQPKSAIAESPNASLEEKAALCWVNTRQECRSMVATCRLAAVDKRAPSAESFLARPANLRGVLEKAKQNAVGANKGGWNLSHGQPFPARWALGVSCLPTWKSRKLEESGPRRPRDGHVPLSDASM